MGTQFFSVRAAKIAICRVKTQDDICMTLDTVSKATALFEVAGNRQPTTGNFFYSATALVSLNLR